MDTVMILTIIGIILASVGVILASGAFLIMIILYLKQKRATGQTNQYIGKIIGYIRKKDPGELPGDVLISLAALEVGARKHEPIINPEEAEETG
jgi:hypothetical protein